MLSVFKINLAPQGVAYVSYNCFPGSHTRNLVRDMMDYHLRNISDPQQRLQQARAALKFFEGAANKSSLHGIILTDELKRVSELPGHVLYPRPSEPRQQGIPAA